MLISPALAGRASRPHRSEGAIDACRADLQHPGSYHLVLGQMAVPLDRLNQELNRQASSVFRGFGQAPAGAAVITTARHRSEDLSY